MFSGFKQFILRGNVVDLAIGVLIGAAFNSVVQALVKDIFTPLIAAIFAEPDFSNLAVALHGSKILYGDFLNALISFIIVAVVTYFFVVLPMNTLNARFRRGQPQEVTTRPCPECLSNIPKAAKRCMYCTANVAPESNA